MGSRHAQTPSQLRSATAVAAVLCVLAAVAGCWLLRFDRAAAFPQPSPTSVQSAHGDGAVHLKHASLPTKQVPVKSAGLHRDRPPNGQRATPLVPTVWSADSGSTEWNWPGGTCARAPAPDRCGQYLLKQFCIARC